MSETSMEKRIENQRREINQLRRQLSQLDAIKRPPPVAGLKKEIEKLRSALTRSIHRGEAAEARLEAVANYRDHLQELAAATCLVEDARLIKSFADDLSKRLGDVTPDPGPDRPAEAVGVTS